MKVYEHEIPSGSKLYFGKNAKLKREIEKAASDILEFQGFSEIITPFFSYHQHLGVKPQKLLRFSDEMNAEISLRGDSTIDVVRIVTRRLKEQNIKKWFYIQPVFFYPSIESYQIGAEMLGSTDLAHCASIARELLDKFGLDTCLQISNMQIPHLLCELLDLPMSVFEQGRIEVLLAKNLPWLNALVKASTLNDIKELLALAPQPLKEPLNDILALGEKVGANLVACAPIYYSKMRYYDKLFFRFLKGNSILASGGTYEIEGLSCAGFAIHSDNLIEVLSEGDKNE